MFFVSKLLGSLLDKYPKRDSISSLEANHCQIVTETIDRDGIGVWNQLVCHCLDLVVVEFGKVERVGRGGGRRCTFVGSRVLNNVNWFTLFQIDFELLGKLLSDVVDRNNTRMQGVGTVWIHRSPELELELEDRNIRQIQECMLETRI